MMRSLTTWRESEIATINWNSRLPQDRNHRTEIRVSSYHERSSKVLISKSRISHVRSVLRSECFWKYMTAVNYPHTWIHSSPSSVPHSGFFFFSEFLSTSVCDSGTASLGDLMQETTRKESTSVIGLSDLSDTSNDIVFFFVHWSYRKTIQFHWEKNRNFNQDDASRCTLSIFKFGKRYPIRYLSRRTSDLKKILYFILKRVVELWVKSHSVDDTCYNFDFVLRFLYFLNWSRLHFRHKSRVNMSFDNAAISLIGQLDLKHEKNNNSTSNTYSSWRTPWFSNVLRSCTAKTIFPFQLILMTFRNTTKYRMILNIFWTKHVRQESCHDPNGIYNTIRRSYIDPSYYITAKFRSNSTTTLLNTPQI